MGLLLGKAQEILSSAIRGEFPSKKTSHGSGGPQDGPLNSTACPGLEPGLPKEPQRLQFISGGLKESGLEWLTH